ncbi:hypothetical protein [Thermomonospora cellulosilytica]|uniref:Secreted protein n=1 Tax=Thermomonospora cellulosilytica TaxID=1411118 RepID=A0A7W3N3U9_9ACTN|nr:hypothetical protein [Thermomonospora cellulosilytica]MBA9006978.1 hypothetical protein [Thermomonospora cellulosilytica]
MAPKTIRRGLLAGLTAAATAVTVVPAASAAQSPPRGQRADQVVTLAARGPEAESKARIRCRVRISDPERTRHHHRRLVKVTGRVWCNHRVDRLRVRVTLYKDRRVYESGWKSDHDRRGIALTVARKCHGREHYKGRVHAHVTFPRGFHPRHRSITVWSDTVYIHRCHRHHH